MPVPLPDRTTAPPPPRNGPPHPVVANRTGQYVTVRPRAARAASTGNRALDQFAMALASRLGIRATPAYMRMVAAWHQAEGGHAAYNPFNTTQRYAGATPYNTFGSSGQYHVLNYPSPQAGVEATYRTLVNGRYAGILNALRQGNIGGFGQAIEQSPWGTSGRLVSQILGQSAPINVRYGGGGGGGGGTAYNYSGGGPAVGGSPAGMSSLPPAPSLGAFLGTDTVYQDQLAAAHKQLAQYLANAQKQNAINAATYGAQKRNLEQANTQSQQGTLESFGARGLGKSSVYGDALTQIARQYAQRQGALQTGYTQQQQDATAQQQAFRDQQLNAQQAAMAAAAARRAAIYGARAGARLGGSAIGAVNPNIRVS